MFQMFPSGQTHPQRLASEFHTDRVIGRDKFTGDFGQVEQRLQERVALPQHHGGPCGALGGQQPGGQALDALLEFGHCGEPTLLFEAAGDALESGDKTRRGEEEEEEEEKKTSFICSAHRWGGNNQHTDG